MCLRQAHHQPDQKGRQAVDADDDEDETAGWLVG